MKVDLKWMLILPFSNCSNYSDGGEFFFVFSNTQKWFISHPHNIKSSEYYLRILTATTKTYYYHNAMPLPENCVTDMTTLSVLWIPMIRFCITSRVRLKPTFSLSKTKRYFKIMKFLNYSAISVNKLSGPQNCKTKWGNKAIGSGLKQLEEVGDFLLLIKIYT